MITGTKLWAFTDMVIQSGSKAKLIMPSTTGLKLRTTYWIKMEGSGTSRAITILDYVKNKYCLIVANNLRQFTEVGTGELWEVEVKNEGD